MDRLTTSQVAALLQVSAETIRNYIDAGKIPSERLPEDGSWRRIRRDDLVKFATDNGLFLDWTKLEN